METQKKQSGLGIASLVIGIVSIIVSCFGAGIIGIIGIVFAIPVIASSKTKHGMAIAGLVASIVGAFISSVIILGMIFGEESNLVKKTEETENFENYYSKKNENESEMNEEQEDIKNSETNTVQGTMENTEKNKDKYLGYTEIKVYDENETIIKIKSLDEKDARIEILNKSENNKIYYLYAMAVNGIMVNCTTNSLQTEIAAEKKSVMKIPLKEFKDIEYIDIVIYGIDKEKYEKFCTGILRLNTEKYNGDKKYELSEYGNILSDSDLDIVCKRIDNKKVSYLLKNKTDNFITTNLKDSSVNEWAFKPSYSSNNALGEISISPDGYDVVVFPNCISQVDINLSGFCEENEINEVVSFEFSICLKKGMEYADYKTIDKIKFEK